MRLHITVFVAALLVTAATMAGVKVGLAQPLPEESEFVEMVMVNVNCTTASVSVASVVVSNNTELVHFPAEINMNATEWENMTKIMVVFQRLIHFCFTSSTIQARTTQRASPTP